MVIYQKIIHGNNRMKFFDNFFVLFSFSLQKLELLIAYVFLIIQFFDLIVQNYSGLELLCTEII